MKTHASTVLHHTDYSRSQCLDKLHNASARITQSCKCKFAAISCYISETVQASPKVTTE